jgi:hypothetical protein
MFRTTIEYGNLLGKSFRHRVVVLADKNLFHGTNDKDRYVRRKVEECQLKMCLNHIGDIGGASVTLPASVHHYPVLYTPGSLHL